MSEWDGAWKPWMAAMFAVVFVVIVVIGLKRPQAEAKPAPRPSVLAKWELVKGDDQGHDLVRTKVPGGWVVQNYPRMIYVPDPGHGWLAPEPEEAVPSCECSTCALHREGK